jgi:hypothetical protein
VARHRRRGGLRLVALVGVAVISMALAGPALAKGPAGEYRDDGTFVPGAVYTVTPAPAWKDDLLKLHDRQRAGTMTAADAASNDAILAAHGLDPSGAYGVQTEGIMPMAQYTSNTMSQTQRAQLQNNWCGPASAQSIVLAWHTDRGYATTSAWDGAALSQSKLATSTYTNAGATGGTDWLDHDMLNALNKWIFDGDAMYAQWNADTVANLESKVALDIDLDWMVGSGTHERAGGPHFNNHPDKDVSHWTTIYGYSNSGSTFKFQDPAANSPALGADWDAVNPYFSMSSSNALSYMAKQGLQRGIAW